MSDWFTGSATLVTAVVAISLYYLEKWSKKKNAARIILQEIRRAEDIISSYKEFKQYRFTKKIIATNSWGANIHYFVTDLSQDSRDRISDLYSTGAYLDSLISSIADYNFKKGTEVVDTIQQQLQVQTQQPATAQQNNGSAQIVQVQIPAPWKDIFDDISLNYEPIYNTTVCQKLKHIAQIK
ncbi:MAG: hypothetical protein WDN66_02615 [Candidatus Saccharibacteria bacterium]